ncbi:SAV_915 family protein [Streptomyces sp. NPDC086023]|uniref:SAV_915 family protein n=1 Tax=Streptomyces sp. NPDC086023 TaxID=3365746 RepID=UPI0037D77B33
MCTFRYEDDPDPEERIPAGPLCVPVRPGTRGVAVRVFRTPLGERTAVGFTTPARLAATLGAGQVWIRLSETALRALTEPLGVLLLTLDPTLTAPAVAPAPAPAPAPRPAPGAAAGTDDDGPRDGAVAARGAAS